MTGDPHVVRSTAGRFESPIGEVVVVAIASEHDPASGTARGPNTTFVFSYDPLRIAQLRRLRPGRSAPGAAGRDRGVDLVFVPVGGRRRDRPRPRPGLRRPMHYRTPAIGFLEPADAFLALFDDVERADGPEWSVPAERPPATRVVVLQPRSA